MTKIRVLVVDDSAVVRHILSEVLAADPDVEVVGTAADGRIALAKIAELLPDLVTLDVEMPGLDGLQTLAQIRRRSPTLPVVMFSALTERAAAITLEALSRGANDYATKPQQSGSRAAALAHVRASLLPKVHGWGRRRSPLAAGSAAPKPAPASPLAPSKAVRPPPAAIELLAVGASTGGPAALTCFLGGLPAELPVPVVVVQHMPPVFTKLFARRLSADCRLPFREVQGGEALQAGQGYVAPGDFHLRLAAGDGTRRLCLDQGPRENSCRPAVDVLLRSAVEIYGPATLAVILTGMGQDGLRGCEQLRAANGQILVQDEPSSVIWGMPGFVARAGLADEILPLSDLAAAVLRRLPRSAGGAAVRHAG